LATAAIKDISGAGPGRGPGRRPPGDEILKAGLQPALAEADRADWKLAADGDVQAFERMYRRHVTKIHSLAWRMVGESEADDITQDVFVRTWEKLGSFRGESSFGTWLYRLAVNLMLERRGSLGARRRHISDEEFDPELVAAKVARTDEVLELDAAIRHLPRRARQVFVLYDVQGYKHEEIGWLLGITTGTSKGQLHRARMTLRRLLGV
jgi:RNA polymerase sigma factor (sigma-70 family)